MLAYGPFGGSPKIEGEEVQKQQRPDLQNTPEIRNASENRTVGSLCDSRNMP